MIGTAGFVFWFDILFVFKHDEIHVTYASLYSVATKQW